MNVNDLAAAVNTIHAEIQQAAQEPNFATTVVLQNLAQDLRQLSAAANRATATPVPNLRGLVSQLCQYLKAHPITEPTPASVINKNAQKAFKRHRPFATMDLKEALQLCGYLDLVTAAGTVWYPVASYPPPRTAATI